MEDLLVPNKLKNSTKNNKSIEVKVNVHLSKASFMSFVLIVLIGLVGYSGYLGVSSLWKFTHPKFVVSLDSLKSLEYVAKGLSIPPISAPNFSYGNGPDEAAKTSYLQSVEEFKKEFRIKFPNSKLLQIPDNDVLNIGWSICTAKNQAISKSGNFSKEEIINAYQSKFVLKYLNVAGLDTYIDGIAKKAFDKLCGGN